MRRLLHKIMSKRERKGAKKVEFTYREKKREMIK